MWIDDQILLNAGRTACLWLWSPQSPLIVLGNSNDLREVIAGDTGIPIYKRCGGGGTVLLHDGCIILSLGLWSHSTYHNKELFYVINQAIIDTLARRWKEFAFLSQDGISDICYHGKKIAGTSLFRSRHYLLYQASLLFDRKIDLIETHLQHPSKEPEYRKRKSHREFMGDLQGVMSSLDFSEVVEVLEKGFLSEVLKSDYFRAPYPEELAPILKRGKDSLNGEHANQELSLSIHQSI